MIMIRLIAPFAAAFVIAMLLATGVSAVVSKLEDNRMKVKKMIEDTQCPVCGYYCLGKGGHGCINKPELLNPPHHIPNWCSFNDLRFVVRREYLPEASDGTRQYIDRRVLQQLWRDINTTLKDSYYMYPEEWRDVPLVQEELEK